MKKYSDRGENRIRKKFQTLNDVLKDSLLKSLVYEKAIKEKSV